MNTVDRPSFFAACRDQDEGTDTVNFAALSKRICGTPLPTPPLNLLVRVWYLEWESILDALNVHGLENS